jgi:hypothetical protein
MDDVVLQAFLDELTKISSLPQLIERGIQRSGPMGRMPFIPLRGAAAKGMEIAKAHGVQDVRGLSHITQHTLVPEGNILHMLGKGVTTMPEQTAAAESLAKRTALAKKYAPAPAWKPGQSGVRPIAQAPVTQPMNSFDHALVQHQQRAVG